MARFAMVTILVLALVTASWGGEVNPLFNGKDLEGWYTWLKERGKGVDPQGVFTVEDGMIHISGEEWGCITSEEEYGNYHLIVEFKWGEKTWGDRADKTRDSGVLIHSYGADGGYSNTWMHSLELQMIEGGTGDLLAVGDSSKNYSLTCPVAAEKQGGSYIYEKGGTPVTINGGRINWWGRDPGWEDVLNFRGAQDVEHPVGEWNRLECIADGPRITVMLNGIVVNEAYDCRPRKGRLQIQSEGAEVFVRRVDLIPLNTYRYIYNSDANNMFIYVEPPMKAEDIYSYVDEVADLGITSYFTSPNWGMNMNYPTAVGDLIGAHASPEIAATIVPDAPEKSSERGVLNVRALIEAGHDPTALVIDHAREKGMEGFVSFRLNEVHAVEHEDHLILSRFWKDHPEWRIGKAGDPVAPIYLEILGPDTSPIVASWLPGGLNFAVPEVRAHRLAQLREVCERFDLDGLDLDFQRFPMYFKPGEEKANIETMTTWMGEVRDMVYEVGTARGRGLLLSARIMAKPEQNRAIGLDPVDWIKKGLLDFAIVSHYLRNDFPLEVSAYRDLVSWGFPLYGSIEVAPDAETYQRIADQMWADGADGIQLFNFFTKREQGNKPPFEIIPSLGRAPMDASPILLVANKHSDTLSYIDPRSLEVLDVIPTGHNPHEIAVTPDQRWAYLSNYAPPGDTISVVDLVARKHVKQIETGAHTRIHGAAMAPDGRHAYFTATQAAEIVEVDTTTHEISRVFATEGKTSHFVVAGPENKYLYVSNIDTENVSVIDLASGKVIKQIPCGAGAEGMGFTPDGTQLWVLNQTGGTITIVEVKSHEVVETFACSGMPVRIAFTKDGKRALVPSWTEAGELIVLDVTSRAEITRIPVGSFAIGVALTPDERWAFVGCEHTDGVHVIDMNTLTVLSTIPTGDGPDPMTLWYPPKE